MRLTRSLFQIYVVKSPSVLTKATIGLSGFWIEVKTVGKGAIVKGSRISDVGRFESVRDVALSTKVFGVRLPVDIEEQVKAKGHEWVREVLRRALGEESSD